MKEDSRDSSTFQGQVSPAQKKKEDIKQLTSGAWVTKTTIYFPTATHLCMHLHTSCEYVCAVRHANCMKVFATKCTRFNSDRLATVTDQTDGWGRGKGSVCRYNVQNKFKPLPPHSTLSLCSFGFVRPGGCIICDRRLMSALSSFVVRMHLVARFNFVSSRLRTAQIDGRVVHSLSHFRYGGCCCCCW